MGPSWRWLVLREADIEDKMVAILEKNDRSLYHKVKAYEIAKSEDQLISEFSVPHWLFLDIEKHFKIREEEATIDFEKELQAMLDKEDQCWFGTEARLELWKQLHAGVEIGPVLYQTHPESKPGEEEKYILSINTVCRILSLTGRASDKRIRQVQ